MLRIKTKLLPVFAILFLACSPNDESQTADKQHNVLLIVSDALRQDVLGCYGGEAQTPNIDWLARHGVLFENSYANSNWTAPSSVTMLTGNYPTVYDYSRTGTFRIHVPDRELLFCEVLRQSGWAATAKVENVHALLHNNLQGFDPIPPGDKYTRVASVATRQEIEQITGQSLDYDPYWHLGVVLAGLVDRPRDQRFYMLYWMLDPHEPHNPSARFKKRIRIDPSTLPQPPQYYERPKLPMKKLSDLENDYVKSLYVAEVESVDERVGFIIETLRRENLLENTYIIFTSDHGEMFGEHGRWGHRAFYYDVLMKIPLIITGPGVSKGIRSSDMVSLVDLTPTLQDLLNVEYKHEMQGESFLPLLSGGRRENDSIYITNIRRRENATAMHRDALISGDYKLIALGDGEFELYNLLHDPGENHNLAASQPGLVRNMYETIKMQRAANEIRKAWNISEMADTTRPMTDEELEETTKKLRALGYIE